MLSGLVFPGAGQFYNNQPKKGMIYIILTLISIIALVFVIMRGFYRALEYSSSTGGGPWDTLVMELGRSRGTIVVLVAILAVSWGAAIVDAYVVGRDIEGRRGTIIISRKGR